MRLLITGGLGYIGSHLCIEALSNDFEVVVLDDLSNSHLGVKTSIEQLSGKKILFKRCSVTNQLELETLFKAHDFNAIIHLAGLKSVEDSHSSPLSYYRVNLAGTLNLLECAKAFEVNRFIFSSSATVYGPPESLPYTENHPVRPISPYGMSKLSAEHLLKDYAKSNPAFRCVALRYFNPIGAHHSGRLKEAPVGEPSNLLPYLMKVASRTLPQLKIFGNDYHTTDGSGVRDYLHVMDLSQGHLNALSFLEKNVGFHCFNLGSGMGHSVFEVVRTFEEVTERKVPYVIANRREGDLAAYWASAERAKTDLNWQTKRGLAEMLKDAWRAHSKTVD
jgi:UDP-glucose 4-epimerase